MRFSGFKVIKLSLLLLLADSTSSWARDYAQEQREFCANYTCPTPKAGETVVCKQTLGDQWINLGRSHYWLVCNQINGYLFFNPDDVVSDASHNADIHILYNVITASTYPLSNSDTHSTFTAKGLHDSVIQGNLITSTYPNTDQAALVKFYGLNRVQFIDNLITNNGNGQLAYGAVELRSSNMDNTFARNTIVANRDVNNVGFFSNFSNQCCNADGVLSSMVGVASCAPPNPPGWDMPCHNRRNIFDSNLVYSKHYSVDFGDGTFGNTIRNNLFVGKGLLVPYEGVSQWTNNTIDSGAAPPVVGYIWHGQAQADLLGVTSTFPSVFTRNIFRSTGSTLVTGNLNGTQFGPLSDTNLFWPSYTSGQPHSVSADPKFIDLSPSDATLRNYRLDPSSPGCSIGGSGVYAGAFACTSGTTDTTPPNISFGAPGSGATLSGTVSVTLAASDSSGIASVRLSAGPTLLTTLRSTPYTYALDTSVLANGPLVLTAVATDQAGNTGLATLSVTIRNTSPSPLPLPSSTSTPAVADSLKSALAPKLIAKGSPALSCHRSALPLSREESQAALMEMLILLAMSYSAIRRPLIVLTRR